MTLFGRLQLRNYRLGGATDLRTHVSDSSFLCSALDRKLVLSERVSLVHSKEAGRVVAGHTTVFERGGFGSVGVG